MTRESKLAGIVLLKNLEPAALARLEARCSWHNYPKSATVIGGDSSNTDVYFVLEGRLRVTTYSPTGREVTFRDLGVGASFGELAAIDGRGRSATVVALADSQLAAIPRTQFLLLLREQPVVALAALENLAALVRDLTYRVVDTSTLTVAERLRRELLRLADGGSAKGNCARIAPVPHHTELASRIGTHREAVTRELGRLTRAGLIARRRGELLIPNLKLLREHVEHATAK